MSKNGRYPQIRIDSKNDLAKRISDKNFSFKESLNLVNDVIKNHSRYWHDVGGISEPEKDKYVRSAKGTKLGRLLEVINRKLLERHDCLIPNFIFGGISGRSYVQAGYNLIGKKKERVLLKLDISRFFEQNTEKRVFYFFHKKCGCGKRGARLLSRIVCVPFGKKSEDLGNLVLARGFATSSRLAVWCNLDIFLKIDLEVKNILKGNDPRLSIFVDDIGITASRVDKEIMERVCMGVKKILESYDGNQSLPTNPKKEKIISYKDAEPMEILGLKLGRIGVSPGEKTRNNYVVVNKKLKTKKISEKEKKILHSKKRAYEAYGKYLKGYKNDDKKSPIK